MENLLVNTKFVTFWKYISEEIVELLKHGHSLCGKLYFK